MSSWSHSFIRGYFRLKLSPTSGCCPWWLIFFKICFIKKFVKKICKEAMNIRGRQIKGALFNFFIVEKCPFLHFPDAAISFYNNPCLSTVVNKSFPILSPSILVSLSFEGFKKFCFGVIAVYSNVLIRWHYINTFWYPVMVYRYTDNLTDNGFFCMSF